MKTNQNMIQKNNIISIDTGSNGGISIIKDGIVYCSPFMDIDNTKEFIGKETKIKLIKNNKGNAEFPGFFASYSREGKLYMNTNFIGDKIFFTTKELNRIKAQETAKPTEISSEIDKPFSNAEIASDMDFDL